MKRNQNKGFTLVEFMVASVLGLIVIGAAGAMYGYTRKLNDVGMARVRVQQNLRTAATMISREARVAGNFGCAALGRWNGPDTTNGAVNVTNPAGGLGGMRLPPTLDSTAAAADRSVGVRWYNQADANAELAGAGTIDSGALVFYYGEGAWGVNQAVFDDTVQPNEVSFAPPANDANAYVGNVVANRGWLVAAGCNHMQFVQGNGAIGRFTVNIPDFSALGAADAGVNEFALQPFLLMAYKVVAYAVATFDGQQGLYRFELADDGTWGDPQLLSPDVTGMTAEYTFALNCDSSEMHGVLGNSPVDNGLNYIVRNAEDGNAVNYNNGKADVDEGPSLVTLRLTYNYPQTGMSRTGTQNNEFLISAAIRGSNVCASRKLQSNS